MDRRNFLRTMIGGVATAAAVRTFPFRVYSFPKEIKVEPLSLTGLRYDQYNWTGTYMGIARSEPKFVVLQRDSIFEFSDAGYRRITEEIDIEEAKRIFPGPFHWQDRDILHYSVLQPDGSVVDA